MATINTYEVHALGPDRVLVGGSFRPQSAGALVAADVAPQKYAGFSAARTSTGLYTVTFTEAWPDLDACLVSARDASGVAVIAQGGDYSASNKTLQIRTFTETTTATKTGFIPIDITSAREIAGDDIQNLAAHGGLLASDSDPSLARVNAATDKALRVIWDTAADTDEIALPPVPMPPDLDASSNVTVHLLAAMGGATDTPTIDIQAWDAVGDTEMGGATAAITGTTVAEYSATLAAANISGHPLGFLNLQLVPAAHTNDALHLYAAWVEYTRSSGTSFTLADLSDDVDNRISFACIFKNTSVGATAT